MKKQLAQWVGIDVSKATLDVYLRPLAQQFQVQNQASGIAELVNRLEAAEIQQVIVESTGGLELEVAQALQAAGIPVSIINPRQGRDFAKASDKLAKTASCGVWRSLIELTRQSCLPKVSQDCRQLRSWRVTQIAPFKMW